ncbi:MAG TPA: hypothetical protein VFW47_17345, partial [Phenylobacterium sp.]|nr:hypothetical protein [Phenylobacterium sp.]
MTSRIKAALSAAAATAVLLLAACSAPTKLAPPPPPPAPAITLGPALLEQASAYRYYMTHVAEITPDFQDGTAIARSLQVGEAYEPTQLLRGAIAYGAVAALQDPAFVAGVKTYAGDADQRRQIAYAIMRDPAYAVGLPGSASAAGLVVAALGTEAQKLYDNGKAVKQSAYDIQKQPWSKVDVPNRDLRLNQAKTLSATPIVGDLAETARLRQASTGALTLGLSASPVSPPYSPVVVRGLAVAALAILGEAGDANLPTVMAVMAEPNVGFCMNMSKLNLYQCL